MPSSNGRNGPRYAPEDPSLPEPWKGLIDGSTGNHYYWNPVTNVTQYEKPTRDKKELPGPPPLPPPPEKKPVSSSVHVSSGRRRGRDEEDGYSGDEHRSGSRSRHLQDSRLGSSRSSGDVGHGHGSRSSARSHGSSDARGGLSVEAYRRQHEITITGDNVPPPYTTFESTDFPSEILKEVHRAGFPAPTPIQAQSWPIALKGSDVVAVAKTGSGKTLGYLLPGFIHIKRVQNNPRAGPTLLVLAPTRELATQIQDEAEKFGRSSRIASTCVYGGAPKGPQLRDLSRGVDVVVATPGRLNDILEMKRISLRQVSYLVLDEADRMLDMGFEPQIRKIVKEIPNRRQTLMFTATWPKEVRKIAADLLNHPIQVNIGNIDELVANKAITQYVEVIKPNEKQRRLEQILRSQESGSKVLVFCTTKRMCDQLSRSLTRQFGAAAIHGDKSQTERDRVLNQFRTGRSPILVATDVAARGLDIKDIRVVVNYDFPTGIEDYVHRIGRTGRAGATGVSYTFFSDQDSKYALDLVKVLEGADQKVPPELLDMVPNRRNGGRSRKRGGVGRNLGRGNEGGRDSSYGGRGGLAPPSSSRSASDRGAYGHNDLDTHDRYDRERNHQDIQKAEVRGRMEPKAVPRGRVRSPSNSLSPSPRPRLIGPSTKQGHNVRNRTRSPSPKRIRMAHGRSLSPSLSPSPKRGHSRNLSPSLSPSPKRGHGRRLSPSPSPSPKRGRRMSRSRSRSRSLGHKMSRSSARDFNNNSGPAVAQKQSPPPVVDEHTESPQPAPISYSPEPLDILHKSYDDGEIRDDQRLVSPCKERSGSRSPYGSNGEGKKSYKDNENKSIPERVNYDGEEEEEGMIMPDEEEGLIHP